jgi:uncharacterized protein YaeQ
MAPKSTVYAFSIGLSDIDRGVYEELKLSVALHPSESVEFMLTRVLAYALEFAEGIAFSPGIGSPDEPAIAIKSLDGTPLAWIDVGSPSGERLHRAAKASSRVAVYCHRGADVTYQQLTQSPIFRGEEVLFFSFADPFIFELVTALDRRNEMSLSRSEQTLYISLNGKEFSTPLHERRLLG